MALSNDPKSKLGCFTYLGDVSNLLIYRGYNLLILSTIDIPVFMFFFKGVFHHLEGKYEG